MTAKSRIMTVKAVAKLVLAAPLIVPLILLYIVTSLMTAAREQIFRMLFAIDDWLDR